MYPCAQCYNHIEIDDSERIVKIAGTEEHEAYVLHFCNEECWYQYPATELYDKLQTLDAEIAEEAENFFIRLELWMFQLKEESYIATN